MTIVRGSPFKIDWKDKTSVITYANRLGPGQIVYKRPDRDGYNITHYRVGINPDWIVHDTGQSRET